MRGQAGVGVFGGRAAVLRIDRRPARLAVPRPLDGVARHRAFRRRPGQVDPRGARRRRGEVLRGVRTLQHQVQVRRGAGHRGPLSVARVIECAHPVVAGRPAVEPLVGVLRRCACVGRVHRGPVRLAVGRPFDLVACRLARRRRPRQVDAGFARRPGREVPRRTRRPCLLLPRPAVVVFDRHRRRPRRPRRVAVPGIHRRRDHALGLGHVVVVRQHQERRVGSVRENVHSVWPRDDAGAARHPVEDHVLRLRHPHRHAQVRRRRRRARQGEHDFRSLRHRTRSRRDRHHGGVHLLPQHADHPIVRHAFHRDDVADFEWVVSGRLVAALGHSLRGPDVAAANQLEALDRVSGGVRRAHAATIPSPPLEIAEVVVGDSHRGRGGRPDRVGADLCARRRLNRWRDHRVAFVLVVVDGRDCQRHGRGGAGAIGERHRVHLLVGERHHVVRLGHQDVYNQNALTVYPAPILPVGRQGEHRIISLAHRTVAGDGHRGAAEPDRDRIGPRAMPVSVGRIGRTHAELEVCGLRGDPLVESGNPAVKDFEIGKLNFIDHVTWFPRPGRVCVPFREEGIVLLGNREACHRSLRGAVVVEYGHRGRGGRADRVVRARLNRRGDDRIGLLRGVGGQMPS